MDNTTLSCAARNIQGPVLLPYPSALTTTIRVIHAVYYILLLICGIFLNTKVIILVAKFKKLQTLSFVTSLQVVVLDMLLCIMRAIIGVANASANRWVFGEHMCSLVGLFIVSTFIVRIFLMFMFVINRFLSVFQPFFYPKHKVKITVSLSIASWSLSLAIGIIGYAMDCSRFTPVSWMCRLHGNCHTRCFYFTCLLYGTIAIPFTILPILLYTILYIKSRKINRSITASMKNMAEPTNRFLAEWKATITFFLLFITVFALTLPNLTVFFVINTVYGQTEVPPALHVLAVVASNGITLQIITDPVVIMRNRDVRDITDQFKACKIAPKCCTSSF